MGHGVSREKGGWRGLEAAEEGPGSPTKVSEAQEPVVGFQISFPSAPSSQCGESIGPGRGRKLQLLGRPSQESKDNGGH